MSRTVTVHSTSGNPEGIKVNSSATTWGNLQTDLNNAGVAYSGMRAIIGETRTGLESSQSILPDGDFKLFLMPVRTKSGLC